MLVTQEELIIHLAPGGPGGAGHARGGLGGTNYDPGRTGYRSGRTRPDIPKGYEQPVEPIKLSTDIFCKNLSGSLDNRTP